MTGRVTRVLAALALLLVLAAALNAWRAPVHAIAPPVWLADAWVEGARCAAVPPRALAGVRFELRPDLTQHHAQAAWDEDSRAMQFAAATEVTWGLVVHEAAHAHRHDRRLIHPPAVRARCPFLTTWGDW